MSTQNPEILSLEARDALEKFLVAHFLTRGVRTPNGGVIFGSRETAQRLSVEALKAGIDVDFFVWIITVLADRGDVSLMANASSLATSEAAKIIVNLAIEMLEKAIAAQTK